MWLNFKSWLIILTSVNILTRINCDMRGAALFNTARRAPATYYGSPELPKFRLIKLGHTEHRCEYKAEENAEPERANKRERQS